MAPSPRLASAQLSSALPLPAPLGSSRRRRHLPGAAPCVPGRACVVERGPSFGELTCPTICFCRVPLTHSTSCCALGVSPPKEFRGHFWERVRLCCASLHDRFDLHPVVGPEFSGLGPPYPPKYGAEVVISWAGPPSRLVSPPLFAKIGKLALSLFRSFVSSPVISPERDPQLV